MIKAKNIVDNKKIRERMSGADIPYWKPFRIGKYWYMKTFQENVYKVDAPIEQGKENASKSHLT